MRFLVVPRKGAPVFTAYIRVLVGGYDEVPGKTGIAHMLEHMAFKGNAEIGSKDYSEEKKVLDELEVLQSQIRQSQGEKKTELEKKFTELNLKSKELVKKEEFTRIYSRNGGADLNATTSQDVTSYFVSLPTNKLELWAYLESSRLIDPVFRLFYFERDVVLEERRMRVDDSPFGTSYEAFLDLAFEKSPYKQPTIGYASDVAGLTATDMKNFYERYYSPDNIVVTLVGDLDFEETKKIIEKHFSAIPKRKLKREKKIAEPEPKEEKRKVIYKDANPIILIGYQKPTLPHHDDYVFDLLDGVLCDGLSSRLFKRLVFKDHSVSDLSCSSSVPGSRDTNMYLISANLIAPHSSDEVINAIQEEIDLLGEKGPTKEELERSRISGLSSIIYAMQDNSSMASLLSYYELVTGSWKYLADHPKILSKIDGPDIQRVVKRYLRKNRRVIVELKKEKK